MSYRNVLCSLCQALSDESPHKNHAMSDLRDLLIVAHLS